MKNKYICWILIAVFLFILGLWGILSKQTNTPNPVIVDSLKEENKNIIIEIHTLDSIKNEEIIKVYHLSNDSSIKLFYKLLSE